MARVADFVVILDTGVTVHNLLERKFETGGRSSNDTALLQFMVKGLTSGDVVVKLNNQPQAIGHIQAAPGANAEHWFTQLIPFDGKYLNNGMNTLQVVLPTGSTDSFKLYSVVCFFHQDA